MGQRTQSRTWRRARAALEAIETEMTAAGKADEYRALAQAIRARRGDLTLAEAAEAILRRIREGDLDQVMLDVAKPDAVYLEERAVTELVRRSLGGFRGEAMNRVIFERMRAQLGIVVARRYEAAPERVLAVLQEAMTLGATICIRIEPIVAALYITPPLTSTQQSTATS